MAPRLSKSKLIAYRQCPKRLWLQEHGPEPETEDTRAEHRFQLGHKVGDIAKLLYDPERRGIEINAQRDGFAAALAQSTARLNESAPLFEAGLASEDVVAFADIMLPTTSNGRIVWKMVEVKSATGVKDYYRDDAAIQALVARKSGVPLSGMAIAVINSDWVYPGGGDYNGLLVEVDISEEAFGRAAEVEDWIAEAKVVLAQEREPERATGRHCGRPFSCEFRAYCEAGEPKSETPVDWLPKLQKKEVKSLIETKAIIDMRDVPDDVLTPVQRRVKAATLTGRPFFDALGAARALAAHPLPALFLDFETVVLPVPVWAGTRPYEQIPFQFSLHRLEADGRLTHSEFLDLTGEDPARRFAEALVVACGNSEPIFVYNRAFEASRIRDAAERFPDLSQRLLPLIDRLVDLLPVAVAHFYHPSQQGSWSIKKLLPAMAPDLTYATLGVQDGEMAMVAYREAVHPAATDARKAEIRQQLSDYCRLDTYAMVRVWQMLAGSPITISGNLSGHDS